MYQELLLFLFEKLGWKIGQKPVFSRFWDEQAFKRIFRKSIFCSVKNTSSCTKIFSKCFFFAENKLFKVEILFFAKVFVFFFIKFFHRNFYIFRFRNSWPNRKCITCDIWFCCVYQSEKHILYMANMKNSLWSEPLSGPKPSV